ncbi:MAG: hypothetical protein IT382_16520 [Deltaproteobacteria bacterium]|nr:hypothetical protein [Deltaproteobacteria bacterium]
MGFLVARPASLLRRTRAGSSLGLARALLCALLIGPVGLSVGCHRDRPEDLIRRTLENAIEALGKKDARQAGAALADDFVDDAGRTKKELVRLAFLALQRGPVFVKVSSLDTQVAGSSATSQVQVLAVQGAAQVQSAADLLDTNARRFDLTLSWRKEGSDWLLTRVDGLPRVSLD